ncbi:helicase-associated domain-containing protein [Candidatus Uhrbacteria bacterium]|nr:helicase-associated domain-containing protein [Candidatus Uhrbacteria bacterium]
MVATKVRSFGKVLRVTVAPASVRAKDVFYLLLDSEAPRRLHTAIRRFAHPPQVEAPEGTVTRYTITGPSLWNFATVGGTSQTVLRILSEASKVPLSDNFKETVRLLISRYGRIIFYDTSKRTKQGDPLIIMRADPIILRQAIAEDRRVEAFCYTEGDGDGEWYIPYFFLGRFKRLLGWLGYPCIDRIARAQGQHLAFVLRRKTRTGEYPFALRSYQRVACDDFLGNGKRRGHDGAVLLGPPGSGKTLEAIAIAARLQRHVLIVTTTHESVRQWIREFLDKTTITAAVNYETPQ